jgi:hypothetical protein
MSKHSATLAGALIAALCSTAVPARAEFCLEATVNATDKFFFRFKKSYPLKPDKLTPLTGKVVVVESDSVVGLGPAYGQILGLPEGDAGNSLGITLAYGGDVTGNASIVLDDNGKTTGGGMVFLTSGAVSVGGQIVDCATEPLP